MVRPTRSLVSDFFHLTLSSFLLHFCVMHPVKTILDEGVDVALVFLKLTHAFADVFPPLKSAAGGALHIVESVSVSIQIHSVSACD